VLIFKKHTQEMDMDLKVLGYLQQKVDNGQSFYGGVKERRGEKGGGGE
jgi:hypothetical protein